MDYQQTLDYLFRQLPMYQRIGAAAYKADLSYTWKLMDLLGHPYKQFKSIHVAGTNGKGSVSHLLASILSEAGYKTGLYTSPHLVDFRERIRINGEMVPKGYVVEFVSHYQNEFEKIGLSFFEWSVGLAFQHFAEEKVEVAIVEVGMGGRLDSTNVIDPDLGIITNIGLDHTQFLGNSIAEIAKEKAGIIKPGKPVVIGRDQEETCEVFLKKAQECNSNIYFAQEMMLATPPEAPLNGPYQHENFQTVLASIEILRDRGYRISELAVKNGFMNVLKNTGLRGRWEILQTYPRVICDVGHNKDGLAFITEQLRKEPKKHLHLVLGFVADKAIREILPLFPKDASFYLCEPAIPRKLPIDELAAIADELQIEYHGFENVIEAYQKAIASADEMDLIFVGGSTFVVADLLTALQN